MDIYHISCQQRGPQLDVTYFDIDRNKDTYDVWSLLKKSAGTKGTYNLQNLRNEWANFKRYTLDEDSRVVSYLSPGISKHISGIYGFSKQYFVGTNRA